MSPRRILKFALIGLGALILFAVPPTLWLFFSYYHQLENEFFERPALLNFHPVDPGRVSTRGEYSFDKKRGKLDIFLHSFAYPYGNFGGEFVELNLKGDAIDSMSDPVTHKPIFSIELEPELISGIFEGEWEQRRLVRLSQIPPTMINAILAAEDHRFYEHHEVVIVRAIMAAYTDFHSGHVRQGG